MNKTQERILTVLERIGEQAKADPDEADVYSDALQQMLDDLQYDDFFGTEGQTDPRGDQRDHEWSMDRVQGLDR